MPEDFYRIKRLPPYVFAEVNRLKAEARAAGVDVIDFGMGNPDTDTPAHIVDKLVETVRKPRTHRYSASRGIPGLRRAQAAYYERRFGVTLNPETEVVATLGSKEGLANLAMAITAPGDVILAPNPSYPIHPYGFIIAGAVILRHIPVAARASRFLTRTPTSPPSTARCAIRVPAADSALVLNYPSNPTAEALLIWLSWTARLVEIRARARASGILSDLAYAEIYFDDNAAALHPAGAGAKDMRGRVHLAVEDLFDARLADGLRGPAMSDLIAALAVSSPISTTAPSRRSRSPPRRR